ncbi:MAG: hypothetical protein ACLUOD_05430 [[Clostridium] innocuum]
MKYTKATARTLYLTGSSYEIGFRLGDVISKTLFGGESVYLTITK